MYVRNFPAFKPVAVPSVLEPGSTGVGTRFHRHWNLVPPALEPRYIRTVTPLLPYCDEQDW